MFSIVQDKIDLERLRCEFADQTCGALVSFEGLVRNHHEGRSVAALAYEHHPIMAVPEGQRIVQEALQQFSITSALAIHRVGDVPLGEAAVITMVASSHRAEAFAACQYLIDEIKRRVPIWKLETYTDGSTLYTEQCVGCSQ